jgi:hypothetical protein
MPYAYMKGDNCYGRGDYYRGDYYRGDPFLGGVFKAIGGAVKGFVTGGPLGAVSGAIGALKPNPKQGTALAPAVHITAPQLAQGSPPFAGIRVGVPSGFQVGFQGPGGGVYPGDQGPVGTMLPQGFIPGCQLKGTRPNKSSYYRRIPGTLQGQLIPKGSVCVKSRRMNIANGRALRRAVRRAQGFAKMARRVMTFVSAKAPKGRAKFKRGR